MEIDFHGNHPDDIVHSGILDKIIQQAWEMGEKRLRLIHGHGHGHGRGRGISPGFVNTNTGYFGLTVRSALRHSEALRTWIKVSTLDRSHPGATSIELKRNPAPTRAELDATLSPHLLKRVRFGTVSTNLRRTDNVLGTICVTDNPRRTT